MINPSIYFLDPVLRGPTIATMLMCLAAALVGVIVFLKRQSLLGEALSHAAYPGVVIGAMIVGLFWENADNPSVTSIAILIGASISAFLGALAIFWLQKKVHVRPDASLCFILSAFFGIGILLASDLQFKQPFLYKQIQVYFYGQSATMSDAHILVYGALALGIILVITLLHKEFKALMFDEIFATSIGMPVKALHIIFFLLFVLSIVIGIRSVGVVLMSAMLIAPVVAARQYTNRLSTLFFLSAFFGVLSAFLGMVFSVEGSRYLALAYPEKRLMLPSGPMIILSASLICLLSLLFAKERGALRKLWRSIKFKYMCASENILKALWRNESQKKGSFYFLKQNLGLSSLALAFLLHRLKIKGLLILERNKSYALTPLGEERARKLVRLHRLWELYLADYLGIGIEKVHRSAEEMEHIITPELERELTFLLKDPKEDPHQQPIPPLV